MAQLDNKLTESIKKWLDTAPNERDIIAGATMLLQLNRNRAMFNTITRKPEREADRLEYELRKHLRIRLDNMTVADVANMDKKVIPSAKEVLETLPVVSTDDEIPEARSARGRRQDHDSLPAHIQALYDNNINLYKKIKGNIIIISHQERIMNIADYIAVVADGKVSRMGTREEILPTLMNETGSACCSLRNK